MYDDDCKLFDLIFCRETLADSIPRACYMQLAFLTRLVSDRRQHRMIYVESAA